MPDLLYTVQPEDEREGLLGVARRIYGDPTRWPAIYEANQAIIGYNPNALQVGQQLILPDLSAHDHGEDRARIYVVVPADLPAGLPGIAARLYGDPERWPQIYSINQGAIGSNPGRIQPGQCLIIV